MDKNYTHEEILNALTVIKEICTNHSCDDCPFDVGGRCRIREVNPCDWILNLPDSPWKAIC